MKHQRRRRRRSHVSSFFFAYFTEEVISKRRAKTTITRLAHKKQLSQNSQSKQLLIRPYIEEVAIQKTSSVVWVTRTHLWDCNTWTNIYELIVDHCCYTCTEHSCDAGPIISLILVSNIIIFYLFISQWQLLFKKFNAINYS